jgi:hypothetical protein
MNEGAILQNNDCNTDHNLGGGGVFISGNGCFTMNGGKIRNNKIDGGDRSEYGGGVYVNDNGTFEMKGGEISGNSADRGAGVYVGNPGSGTKYVGTFIKTGGTIYGSNAPDLSKKNNATSGYGHAVYVDRTPRTRNSTADESVYLDSSTSDRWE